ncbi:putative lipoprotein [Mariprofundus ferrinatatus]|uniref:Putative lipoprotein n=1 Tax=Mariprofundus ferrinatatus TaxID=1921087 RepID=A0A2K8L3P6_9PROT|nr:YajG family lipoprotein [Mariprofundus ferrinatatus]ATX81955.1 putative lipoprotein [Mariprofundus ferrinatatus]
MKKQIMLMLVMLVVPCFAHADEISLDITYPKSGSMIEHGSGEVAIWVEDAREGKVFGKSVDGVALVASSDVASSLYAYMVSSLKQAGYTVVPYSAELVGGLLIQIRTVRYHSVKEMVKSNVKVGVALEAKANNSNATRTYKAAVEDEFAWKPSDEKSGEMIGRALATAADAALSDLNK